MQLDIYPLTIPFMAATMGGIFLYLYPASYFVESLDAGKHFAMTITFEAYKLADEVIFYEL